MGASEDLHETFARLQTKVVTVQDNPNTLWMIELSRKNIKYRQKINGTDIRSNGRIKVHPRF